MGSQLKSHRCYERGFCGWLQDWLVNFTLPWLYRRDGGHLYSRARRAEGVLIGSDIRRIKKFETRTVPHVRVVRTPLDSLLLSFRRFPSYLLFVPVPRPLQLNSHSSVQISTDQEDIDVMPPFVESKCSIIREIGSFFTFSRRSIFVGPNETPEWEKTREEKK